MMRRKTIVVLLMAAVLSAAAQADVYIVYDVSDGTVELDDWTAYLNSNFTAASIGTIYSGEYTGGAPAAVAGDLVVFTRGVDPKVYDDSAAEVAAWNGLEAGILHLSFAHLTGNRFGYYDTATKVTGYVTGSETAVLNPADPLFAGVTITSGSADLIKDDATLWNLIETADMGGYATAATGEGVHKDSGLDETGSAIIRFPQGSSWASTVGSDPSGTHGGDRIFYSVPNKDVNLNPGIVGLTADGLIVLKNCLVELGDLGSTVTVISPLYGDLVAVSPADILLQWENIELEPTDQSDIYVDVWFGTDPNKITGPAAGTYDRVVKAEVDGLNEVEYLAEDLAPGIYYWQVDTYITTDIASGDPCAIEGKVYKFTNDGPVAIDGMSANIMTWLSEPALIVADVKDDGGSDLEYTWSYTPDFSDDPNIHIALVQVEGEPSSATLTVTNDDPKGEVTIVQVTVTVQDATNPAVTSNAVSVDIYDTACLAAREGLGLKPVSDIIVNCDTDMTDLAIVAEEWLADSLPVTPYVTSIAGVIKDGVIYNDNYDNDGLDVNTGAGGGVVSMNTSPASRSGMDAGWVDDGNLTMWGNSDNGANSGGSYSINAFDLSGGFKLEVTYNALNSGDRFTMGLMEEAGTLQRASTGTEPWENGYVATSGSSAFEGIYFNAFAPDSRYPNAEGLQLGNGTAVVQLSDEQTRDTGVHTLVLEVDADSNWSYSIDDANSPTTGTIDGGFDFSKKYSFITRHQPRRPSQIIAVKLSQLEINTDAPDVSAGSSFATWSGQEVVMDPNIVTEGSTWTNLTYSWAAEPSGIDDPDLDVAITGADTLTPTVTVTKAATGDATAITMTLTVSYDGNPEPGISSSVVVKVYDDACKAKLATEENPEFNLSDITGNCITNLVDFAVLSEAWLNNYTLTEPVDKP